MGGARIGKWKHVLDFKETTVEERCTVLAPGGQKTVAKEPREIDDRGGGSHKEEAEFRCCKKFQFWAERDECTV